MMKEILTEWRKYLAEADIPQDINNLATQINNSNGAVTLDNNQKDSLIKYIKANEKSDPLSASFVAGALYVYYRDKLNRGDASANGISIYYRKKMNDLRGSQDYTQGSTIRAADQFLGVTDVASIEKGLYSSNERPAFAKFIDNVASYFKAETGLNILDPSRPFTPPNWAKNNPATYAALQTLADFAASDPFTAVQNASILGAVEKYAANSLLKKELSEGIEQVSKKIAVGQVTEKSIQSEVQSIIKKAKSTFEQTIERGRGGFSPQERAYWAERYNTNRATQLKNVDKAASPEKAKKVAEIFKQHLENAGNVVTLSDQNFIKRALNFTTEEGKKMMSVIYQHVHSNYTFPKDLADKLFRIAKTGKSELVQLYKGYAFKGVSIDFAEQLVGEAAIPKTPGVHRVKLKTPIYLDPEQNAVRSYRSKYNYEVKSPVSEWTSEFQVAKDYSLNPMSSEAKKTLISRGNQQTIAILEAQAVPGQNNFLNYELLKDKAGFGKGGVIDLYQGELLSYGKVRVDEIIIINK